MTPLTKYDNSMIKEFQACPRKFYLRYVLHLTSKDTSNKFKAEFGSALHAGLQAYYEGETLEKCKVRFTEYWLPYEGDDPKGIRSLIKGLSIIEDYIKNHPIEKETWEVVYAKGAELELAVDISCKETGEVLFIGKIDLAVRDRVSKIISPLDHKTTAWSNFLTVKPNHQLAGYSYSLQEMMGEEVDGGIINQIYFTKHQIKYTREKALFDRDYLENDWLKDIRRVISWIKGCFKTDFFPKNTDSCSNYGGCDFRLVCMHSQLSSIYPSLLSTLFKEDKWEPYPGARQEEGMR